MNGERRTETLTRGSSLQSIPTCINIRFRETGNERNSGCRDSDPNCGYDDDNDLWRKLKKDMKVLPSLEVIGSFLNLKSIFVGSIVYQASKLLVS